MSEHNFLAALAPIENNIIVQAIILAVIAFGFGWITKSLFVGSALKKAKQEMEKVQKSSESVNNEIEQLNSDKNQILADAAELRSEAIAENDLLKRELHSAREELEKSRTEIISLSDALPSAINDTNQVAAVRDALALAEADITRLDKELDAKSEELSKWQHKADIAIKNAINISDDPDAPKAPNMAGWRARFLESRIRLLEAQVRNADTEITAIEEAPTDSGMSTPVTTDVTANSETEATASSEPATNKDSFSNEEELASLRWRVRYLETRLSSLGGDLDPVDETETEPTGLGEALAGSNLVGDVSRASDSPIKRLADSLIDAEVNEGNAESATERQSSEAPPVQSEEVVEEAVSGEVPEQTVDQGSEDLTMNPVVPCEALEGIGPLVAQALSREGIDSLEQLASLNEEDSEVLDKKLGLGGRIVKEGWVAKAQNFLDNAK